MTRLEQIELEALALPEAERELLAEHLLQSLQPTRDFSSAGEDEYDDPEGIAIAEQRLKELENNPGIAISWEEMKKRLNW